MTKYTVDPPSGWQYGFPKEYTFEPSKPDLTDAEYDAERVQWFVDNGYPQSLIDQGQLKYCRSWLKRED